METSLPKVYKVATKILSVCATSAKVERVFSHGGIFIQPHQAHFSHAVKIGIIEM